MSKTCKKLLASALAAAMLISTFVSSLVVSAADSDGILEIGTATITESSEAQEASVDMTFDYTAAVTAPHNLIKIDSQFDLSKVVVKTVDGATAESFGTEIVDDIVISKCPVKIGDFTADSILLETDVTDAKAFDIIVLTATFTIPAGTAVNTDGYPINATSENTNLDEDDLVVTVNPGSIKVNAAHVCEAGTPVSNENGTHDIPCEGCDKLVADDEQCTYGDDGACTVCGYKEPVEEIIYVNWGTISYDFDKSTVHVPFTITDAFTKVLKDASNAGNRQRLLKVTVNGKDYDFGDQKILSGSNDTTVGGFNITKLNAEVTIKWNITWNGGEMTANTYTFVIADELKKQYESGSVSNANYMNMELLGKFVAYNDAYLTSLNSATSQAVSYNATDCDVEEEQYLDYSTGYIDLKTNTFAVNFTITDAFTKVLKNASNAGNRQRILFVEAGGKVYNLGDQKILSGNNTSTLSGFSAVALEGTFKLYYKITWNGGEMTTNAIIVDIPTVINGGDSELVNAYKDFISSKDAFYA